MPAYLFDNEWEKERERLAGLESLYDPGTIRHLESIGVGEGWRCLEVGGGGGSIVQWLSRRVGSNGRVMATDVNTRFLDALHEPNLEVRRHDIVNDELPIESFDLVHARLLLEHLPDRDQALKRMVSALAPGGWLLVEDFDTGRVLTKPPALFRYPSQGIRRAAKISRAVITTMQGAGYDPAYGAKLPGELIEQALVDIGGEMRTSLVWGGSRGMLMPAWTLEQLRGLLVEAGVAETDIDRELATFADPNVAAFPPIIVAAWGRKPESEHRTAGPLRMRPRTESALDWLRGIPLFEGCTQAELSRIAATARRVDAFAGDILTAEGDPGDTFYLIATGSATVTRGGARLAMLGPGSFFGEIAIIDRGPRTATVRAETPMRMFELGLEDFAVFFRDIPLVRERIQAALAERKARDLDSLE